MTPVTPLKSDRSGKGRQGKRYSGTGYKSNATSSEGNNASGQARVVKCYNCQGEGHMARQCTQPKRPRNAAWYKDKAMLAEAQEARQILDEEQLAFLADLVVPDGQAVQTIIPNNVAVSMTEIHDYLDSDGDDISNAKVVLMADISNYGSNVISETLYDGSVISSQHVASPVFDDEETLILEELNQLSEDFGKRFVPQQELSNKQAFWLQTSHPNTDQSASSLVKIEAPRKLPKVSMVNTSLKNIKYHLGKFDTVVKKRITPDALTEEEWGFEHPKVVFLKEIILFLKTLKDIFNVFDKDLLNEVTEVQIVFNQMEAAVQQYFVDKQYFEIHKNELFLENDRLLQKIMSQDVMIGVMNSTAVFDDVNVEMQSSESCVKCLNLDAELLNKQNKYNDLLKHYSQLEKHCISLELTIQLNQEIFQKESFTNNQNALEILEYFKNNDLKAQLQAKDTTIFEQAKAKQPIYNALDLACKHATRIQESLVYVRDTCPNAIKLSEKKVAITPMNKVKKVRFSEPLISSSNIQQVESSKMSDSNTPVLSSTGLKCSTSTCRSQPTGNKKNNRISQKPSSNKKNKVEAQPKKVNKKNRVKEPICYDNVKHTMLNANSQLIYVKFKTPKPEIKVYSRRPKQIKSVGSSKKAKIVESKIANNSEPNHTWGSNATDIPSSSSLVND
ncbi:integrase, catalytic region, zinc finger, CCHC-type containing protein, partial [Tanacetum coccineum]